MTISVPNLRNHSLFQRSLGLTAFLSTKDWFCMKSLPQFELIHHKLIFLITDMNRVPRSFVQLLPFKLHHNHKSIYFQCFWVYFQFLLRHQCLLNWYFLNDLLKNDWYRCILDLYCKSGVWLICKRDCLTYIFLVFFRYPNFQVQFQFNINLFCYWDNWVPYFSFFHQFLHISIGKIWSPAQCTVDTCL